MSKNNILIFFTLILIYQCSTDENIIHLTIDTNDTITLPINPLYTDNELNDSQIEFRWKIDDLLNNMLNIKIDETYGQSIDITPTKVGLDYISCSPFRVPIARLAAAQSAINP